MADQPAAETRRCPGCFAEQMEAGFLEDAGEHSRGHLRWIPGPLEKGLMGGARRLGKVRHDIHAWRCSSCGRLDLVVP